MKAVVFDLGNVLVEWTPLAVLSEEFMRETDFFAWNAELDRGASLTETLERLRTEFPHHVAHTDAFDERWPETLGSLIQDTVDVVDDLQSRGVRCFVLSNSSAETVPRSELLTELLKKFDGVLLSGEVGVLKPDLEIYRIAEKQFGLDPSATWFVDDNEANAQAATACGWHGIHFTSPEVLRPALVEAGVL
ncbi:MAG: 2-haloacid dehalogenase [Actinomycetota bacterium]